MSTLPYYSSGSPEQLTSDQVPVQLAVAWPVPQQRATVFFRLLMVVPHYFVLYFLGLVAGLIAFVGWWAALFTGRLPEFAQTYLSGYIQWSTRVQAYLILLTGEYPPFSLEDDPGYPVRIAIPAGGPLNRAAVFFRLILVIPANLLGGLAVMGGAIVSVVAWLITLIAGRLPETLHLAYTAILRYLTRTSCYLYLLTPAYPSGLFGDGPPVPGGPARGGMMPGGTAPGGTAPGGMMPGMMPGGPAPGGFAPGGFAPPPADGGWQPAGDPAATQPGYPTPGYDATGYDATGYGATGYEAPAYGSPGYGAPAYGSPGGYGDRGGYGTPGGYGAPGQVGAPGEYGAPRALWEPADWRLLLTAGARRLVGWIIGIGVAFWALWLVVIVLIVVSAGSVIVAQGAITTMNAANDRLGAATDTWNSQSQACKTVACATGADATAATAFSDFATTVKDTPMPANAITAANRLYSDASTVAQVLTGLSKATTVTQYNSELANSGLQQTLQQMSQANDALAAALNHSR